MTASKVILIALVVITFLISTFAVGYMLGSNFGKVRRRPETADDDTADVETRARRARSQIIREEDR